jgi:predicted RNase H-like nuclease (RuvC/YqgF family)
MSRSIFTAAVVAGLAFSVAPTLRAQSSHDGLPPIQAAVQAAVDSVRPHQLATVVVMAEADPADERYRGIRGRIRAREDIRAMERQNRSLAIQVKRYDHQIAKLEGHLHHLKTVVTDSLKRETAEIDSATASIRARRLELEARLKEMEAKSAPLPVIAATPSDSVMKKTNE